MEGRTTAVDDNASQSGGAFLRSPPLLVGREREREVLRAELFAAGSGRGRLVLLGGEAGIGKSTLAQDLVGTTAGHTTRVLAGHCYDLTNTPPYGPWLDLFQGSQPVPDMPVPPAAFAGGVLAAVTDRAALFADVRRFFAELSTTHPTLVLLEDLHWADPASLELLRHVASNLRHWPVLLLATYRVDELTRRHPFAQQLPALVREAEGLRLELRRLDEAALRALVASRYNLPAADEARLVTYLEQHAEGNPFFATELLRALEEEALLRQVDGRWVLHKLDHVVVPTFLRQVIEGRVARLGEEVREPLAMAAVIGQEAPLALWGEVANLSDEALLAIVEQAIDAHLLAAERDGTRVRFVHALTREALYEGIASPRRRLWHKRVAEALLTIADPDPDAVATHLQQAGDPRAWEWLVKAGDRAQRAYAWVTAAERLRAAAGLLDGVEDAERTRYRLARRIGWLQRFSDPAGALPAVDDALRAAARLGDELSVAELGWVRATLLGYSDRFRAAVTAQSNSKRLLDALETVSIEALGMPNSIQSWFADALPAKASIDTTEDELDLERSREAGQRFRRSAWLWFCASSGQLGTSIEADEEFVASADVPRAWERILAAVAFTYLGLGIVHAARGHPDKARRMWTRARELFAEFDHHAVNAFTLLNELRDVALIYSAADPATRRRLAADAEAALGRAGGALGPGVSSSLARLNCLIVDGHWDEADRILEDLPLPGNNYLRREVTDARATLARHRGQPEVALAQIRPLFPQGAATEPGDLIHQEGLFLQRLAADLCLDAGDLAGARVWLEAHDRWLAWSESVLGRADGQLAWARWHWADGDPTRARAAAEDTLALATMPDQPLVRLAAHRLLGEIETAAGHHEVADTHLSTALDLAGACEAPFERALTLLVMAELRTAQGITDEGTTLLANVQQVCASLGAALTLARAEALAARLSKMPMGERYPGGLSEREVEVLRLLPRGLSNAEIGARLFLSPRTVQTHLTNLYGKLGVGGRAEAVAYAMAHGLV
jgi:DNA-binding CsgD family transcriptional regulator